MVRPALVTNFLLFQLGWIVSVVGAAYGHPFAGVAYALVWAALHHWRLREGRVQELALIAGSAVVGFLVDSLLVLGGVMEFPEYASLGYPTTLWMVGLWLMFAMTLRHSLGWLRSRYLLAAVLGAVFGPLAYWAGSRIGAIHLHGQSAAIIAIAAAWSASMVCLLRLETFTRAARGAGQ